MPSNERIENLRAALQAARHARHWDDATYYGRLETVVGRPICSTKDLTREECARCLDDINGARRHQPRSRRGATGRAGGDSRPAMLDALRRRAALVRGADGQPISERYLEAILRRQRGIADPSVACPLAVAGADGAERILASAKELRGLLAALNRHQARAQA